MVRKFSSFYLLVAFVGWWNTSVFALTTDYSKEQARKDELRDPSMEEGLEKSLTTLRETVEKAVQQNQEWALENQPLEQEILKSEKRLGALKQTKILLESEVVVLERELKSVEEQLDQATKKEILLENQLKIRKIESVSKVKSIQ